MEVLVTGGAGFIGSHIVDVLLEQGHRPVVVDDLSAGTRSNLPSEVEFCQLDVTAPGLETAFAGHRYDVVIHCAAMVGVVQSMGDPSLDRHVNVEGTSALLALCRRYGSPKFVFLSSGGAVYGETPVPATEATSPAPLSYYGVHKYCAEKYVEFSGLPYVSLRLANVYGPRQRAGLEGGAVAIFAERLQSGLPLEVFGSGEQVRDFVYVTDVAEAAVLAATTPVSGLWNIGTGTATSVNALWRQLGTLMGIVPEVRYHPPRQGEIIRSCLSIQRAIEDGWWRPRYGLEDGLRAMLKALGPPDR